MLAFSWLCYQRAARNRYSATLTEAMNIVTARYISDVEPRVLFEGAMDGMIHKLDAYSAYTSPEEFHQFKQQMEGELTGIGIMVDANSTSGQLTVLESLIGKPAHRAGIRQGDVIVAIDGKSTKGVPLKEAISLIRGRAGTKVALRVERTGHEQPLNYDVERTLIPIESVLGDAHRPDGSWVFRLFDHPRIGFIRIVSFGERTAEEFQAALASYRRPGQEIDSLIIDLRYNPGGLLTAATDVCDSLIDSGVIVTTRGRSNVLMQQHRAQAGTDLPLEVPIAVLVDRFSASAAEIVAACLQDHHRVSVVGQRTWGKGTVQNVIKLEGGRSALRLTVGSYHRPNGKEIHKWKKSKDSDDWGVRPDDGLEVLVTNRQHELITVARRERDRSSWEDLERATTSNEPAPSVSPAPPVPVPQPDSDEPTTQGGSSEAEGLAAARHDPASIDPQLKKAIDHLVGAKAD